MVQIILRNFPSPQKLFDPRKIVSFNIPPLLVLEKQTSKKLFVRLLWSFLSVNTHKKFVWYFAILLYEKFFEETITITTEISPFTNRRWRFEKFNLR